MAVRVFDLGLDRVNLHERGGRHVSDRLSRQIHSRGRGGVHGGHGGGSRLVERRVVHPGVVPAALGLRQQEALFSRLPRGEERLSSVALAVGQGLGEGLEAGLWQQEDADDADEGAAGEDDVVEEVALLVVELHDGSSQHAETSAGEDQAHTTAPESKQETLSPGGIKGLRPHVPNNTIKREEAPSKLFTVNKTEALISAVLTFHCFLIHQQQSVLQHSTSSLSCRAPTHHRVAPYAHCHQNSPLM